MKISLDNRLNYHKDITNMAKAQSNAASAGIHTKNYDAVTIQSDSRQIFEKTFSDKLKKSLTESVRQTTGEPKINDLKSQIQAGTYSLNFDALASRMLLIQEDTIHA